MKKPRFFSWLTPEISIKSLLQMLALWTTLLLFLCLPGLNEYETYGRLTDHRNRISIYGNDAKITVYAVTILSSLMMVYTLCLLLVALYRNRQIIKLDRLDLSKLAFPFTRFTGLWTACWAVAGSFCYYRYGQDILGFLIIFWPFLLTAFLLPVLFLQNRN